ncbi:MAG: Mur ligase family protein [Butyrivibrio sp.]
MSSVTDKFKDKRILVWGYGREGKSTENFLKNCCNPLSVDIFEGKREDIDESAYDYIFKSPGIVMEEDNPKYTSQTEVFLEEYRDRVIGVTGTKGKSTTSSMIYKVLSDCTDHNVLLLGNIGEPCLNHFEHITDDTIVVFEMSCHQLAHTKVSPHIGIFLNLFEEHLDYYGTVEKYFTAKSHIAMYQKEGDFFLVGENVPEICTDAKVIRLNFSEKVPYEIKLLGAHNRYNARFAEIIAEDIFDCDKDRVKKSISEFECLPHRLQFVAEKDGISYYDDSISTIPEAAVNAVKSVPNAGTVLIGGMDRNIDYTLLEDFIRSNTDINFICMYASGKRIYEIVKDCPNCVYVDDLDNAVATARRITGKGRACILSPAAASYGYFKNFEERGLYFCRLVTEK